jgi:hypothetical protein
LERTVPSTGSEEIDLYMRTYYSLLRSTDEIQIASFVETHTAIDSSLHPGARGRRFDTSALVYSSLRLPPCMRQVRLVVLGQSAYVFHQRGFKNVEGWHHVSAPGRRRRTFYDGNETLAVFIASQSDIDDIIPMLTAYQIEWNKAHAILAGTTAQALLEASVEGGQRLTEEDERIILTTLDLSTDDFAQLKGVWGDMWAEILLQMSWRRKQMALRLLSGSLVDYRKATQQWWNRIEREIAPLDLIGRPVYFVSSNTHSLVNLLTGYALEVEDTLIKYIQQREHFDLLQEFQDIEARAVPSNRENFFYYVLKKYLQEPEHQSTRAARNVIEATCGIHRVPSRHVFDVEAQIIEINKLQLNRLDRRICFPNIERLSASDAVIINIDYPLGMAAYQILSEIAQHVDRFEGAYIIGKAASLNGRIGDVIIPNVVHDEHSRNTYLFHNCFRAADVAPCLVYGTVLDNQKAITVMGTFLQNQRYVTVFYREGYTDIEMEAGPYLSALYEAVRPQRHPVDEIVDLHSAPFDLGILHYVSDTPLSKAKNLGAQHLSYFGMDPTYATTLAVLRRILSLESKKQAGLKTVVPNHASLDRVTSDNTPPDLAPADYVPVDCTPKKSTRWDPSP